MINGIEGIRRRTWAEIDLDKAEHNFSLIKNAVNENTKICCVVKANGYGHSAVNLSKLYEALGADFLAVSNIEEALQLRNGGIKLPILILGYTPEECAELLSDNNISQCVYSSDYANRLSSCAKAKGKTVKVHIKLDTGMGRIGFKCDGNEIEEIYNASKLGGLAFEGIFTHFAVADESEKGKEYTKKQFESFMHTVNELEKRGVTFLIRHLANSAAIFDYPEFGLDMVRAGIVLYGLKPSDEVKKLPELKPVMTVKSIISHIKTLNKGESVSYGRVFTAEKETKVATVPIGYADGFLRGNFKAPYSLMLNGKRVPIIGRVCMDQLMLDVTDVNCAVGDEVTVFGGHMGVTADDIARINGTINYEIVCAVGERVPRAFIRNGKIISWRDGIYSSDL